ncbi:ATP-dependent protease La [Pneumocystis jirovecii RU7]|uniref:Lon protease homolog, mitochondrial n=1 Tax=Pneumocystis jirovecii (strain RU7) TaxID=1408657 RepID=A0A0W4ZWT6_PNEJ7|nr:ATP-dependent protease La [Pneumocystis jirovecii RU7]KTW32834.1 ATP-dependent protease La [Pneumocystis jirovecii RU7]
MLATPWTHTRFYLSFIRCRKDKCLVASSLLSVNVVISAVFLFLSQKCYYGRGLKMHYVYLKKNTLLPLGIHDIHFSSSYQQPLRQISDFFRDLNYKEFCKNEKLKKKNIMLRKYTIRERIFRICFPEFRVYGCRQFSTLSSLLKSSGSGGNHGKGKFNGKNQEHGLQKPVVPEVYPRMMALPIVRRPLFPGFYKAVVIKNPSVTEAIKEMIKRGQPYIGAFLLKEDVDTDTITNINQIYNVGVFSQITSVFPANNTGDENALTVVLYPHRRIKIVNLIGPQVNADGVENSEELINNNDNTKSENFDSIECIEEQNVENNCFNKETTNEPSIDDDSHYATSFLNTYDVSLVNVENLVDEDFDPKNNIIKAVTSEIVSVFKDIATFNPLFRDQIANFSMSQSIGNVFEEPAKLADFAAAVSTGEVAELQDILETLSIEARLQKSLLVLKKELMNAQLQSKISKDVESKIQKRQREYYLIEQMKGIKRELGLESDGKDKLVEKFKDKASKLSMPENVKKTFDEELNKLIHLEPSASEFNVTRNYLDWLTQIPWGQQSAENYDINHAMKVLDEDHYGLKDIKDRILEFIAVGKLRGSVEGKILCFVGPPGVGKTSIGKSIARALDRQFYRFSVGGLSDVAEIKGHRRTYVGAMPGKIIQSLKKVQTENPLILIDEVDKIGRGHQGDPSSALLELLDPEQNSSFLDHYLDLPVDLSKVLFVCTANIIDTIPGPLLDRMEIIHISGYVADEKMAIAKNYLAPEAKELAGLKDIDVNLTDDAIESLIKYYCRESGVRNLKKHINKVYRKSTLDIVKGLEETVEEPLIDEKKDQKENDQDDFKACFSKTTKKTWKPLKVPDSVSITIDSSNLKNYVGPPIFTTDRLYDIAPPGVVMGLAWTSQGGAVLYVESILENVMSATSKPNFICTGQLGDVMKESSSIAYSYSKSYISQNYPDNKFFERARIHLHCPEGAVPKDGPSAGITMTTSILSLALNYPVPPSIAMTGEITLTGKVLRIGGLREKVVAAKRSGVDTIIYPEANQADWDILPDNIKKGLIGVPVNWYFDVFGVVFKDIDNSKVSMLWKNDVNGNVSKAIS